MNPQREPTNAEIYEKLGNIEGRVTTVLQDQNIKISEILEQVKKTNGRVTRLERWKDKLDIIADYKKENNQGEIIVDWPKIIMMALGLVASALSVIAWLAGKK